MVERITSRSNPLMVHVRKLAASRSYRRETGEYLGDGAKLLAEAVRWDARLAAVVYTAGTALPELPPGVRLVEVPEDLMRSVSPMEAPQGILFLAKQPPEPDLRPEGGRYLALEGVQDPGNVGTVLRTADAFGADGVLLLPGCADVYNPKTVRASMGAVFRLPVRSCTLAELGALAKEAGLPILGAALRPGAADPRETDLTRGVVLIGSEGRGLTEETLALCGTVLRIPMRDRCESLNAAMAAGVLLWEGYRQSR